MYEKILSTLLIIALATGSAGMLSQDARAQAQPPRPPSQQPIDKLMAPVALYPDSLLAQVLACSTSPQQVTEMNSFMANNSQLRGTELQQAADEAGFDASFIALALFPDVLALMGKNIEWTTEVGKAFVSDQKMVFDSVQRLRAQAKAAGNLKTNEQQEVKTETANGQTVIIVEPANPQVVYVPQYDSQAVYNAGYSAGQADDDDDEAAAALIGFGVGVLLGAAMNDHYGYDGWGAWGCAWHTNTVVIAGGGAWHAPPHGHYGYVKPVNGYRPPSNVYAPTYNNINVNVNNSKNITGANKKTTGTAKTGTTAARTAPQAQTTPRPTTAAAPSASARAEKPATRGAKTTSSTKATPANQAKSGGGTSAFSGYQKGSSAKASSARGRSSSASSSKSGSGRRR